MRVVEIIADLDVADIESARGVLHRISRVEHRGVQPGLSGSVQFPRMPT